MPNRDLWSRNGIQFPRLLAELRTYGLTEEQYAHLQDSMDLDRDQIDELLERAESDWQALKIRYVPIDR